MSPEPAILLQGQAGGNVRPETVLRIGRLENPTFWLRLGSDVEPNLQVRNILIGAHFRFAV